MGAVIAGTGLYTPAQGISNAELVESYNRFVEKYNAENASAIEVGEVEALQPSSVEFIEKASGIKHRYVLDKQGVLDVNRMRPSLETRGEDQLSWMAEMAVEAGRQALDAAGLTAQDVDGVICAASNMQRAYPAMAVEIQDALGIDGWGFDMNVACATAVFGIDSAVSQILSGQSKCILMVNPEITSAHLNFQRRDCHFIFGDVCTAAVIAHSDLAGLGTGPQWDIKGVKLKTKFSNNIRNDFGFTNRAEAQPRADWDLVFRQDGRRVYRDVVPMVAELMKAQLGQAEIETDAVSRFWLHQANRHMNDSICERVLGSKLDQLEPGKAPVVLDEYANTSSAGCLIAFHKHQENLSGGDLGMICAFGAGYSIGSAIVQKR